MIIKIYWRCNSLEREVYVIKKEWGYVSGFVYPIMLTDIKHFLPHWTYHGESGRPPVIHHKSFTGKEIEFMTLKADYLRKFSEFNNTVIHSTPSYGASFQILGWANNTKDYPAHYDRKIVFDIDLCDANQTRYVHILLLDRNSKQLKEKCADLVGKHYELISYEVIDDGNQPNIMILFTANKSI